MAHFRTATLSSQPPALTFAQPRRTFSRLPKHRSNSVSPNTESASFTSILEALPKKYGDQHRHSSAGQRSSNNVTEIGIIASTIRERAALTNALFCRAWSRQWRKTSGDASARNRREQASCLRPSSPFPIKAAFSSLETIQSIRFTMPPSRAWSISHVADASAMPRAQCSRKCEDTGERSPLSCARINSVVDKPSSGSLQSSTDSTNSPHLSMCSSDKLGNNSIAALGASTSRHTPPD